MQCSVCVRSYACTRARVAGRVLCSTSRSSSTLPCLLFTASGLFLVVPAGTARLCRWHCKHSMTVAQQQQLEPHNIPWVLSRFLQGLYKCIVPYLCLICWSSSDNAASDACQAMKHIRLLCNDMFAQHASTETIVHMQAGLALLLGLVSFSAVRLCVCE